MLKSLFSSNQPKDGQAIESKVSDVSLDFALGLIGLQQTPPSPLPRMVLRGLMLLLLAMLIWSYFGRLDVVAVAEGKLVPVSYLKIVQPSEAGIVREIAIKEGQTVQAGRCWYAWMPI
jgi:hemolysin D